MAANTHRIKLRASDAPAEDVPQATIDALKQNRTISAYEVSELKPVAKPADLEKSSDKKAKAE